MKKLGIFVGENMWTFFREIYAYLDERYETQVFEPPNDLHLPLLSARVNRWRYHQAIRSILENSDVCFFEWASELLFIASQMPKSTPIVARLHSFELYEWAPRINWENVDKIIFISEHIREKFIAQHPSQAEKTVVIYNAIPVKDFPPIQRDFDFSLGMLGKIAPIKRVYEMILFVSELRDTGYPVTLHLGGGTVRAGQIDRYFVAAKRAVAKLELHNAVRFYGYVQNPATWLANVDVFISNSYWEGLQTALLEAMATGRYCLGHFWDGIDEVLPSANIYTTNADLKEKLLQYAELPQPEKDVRCRQMTEIVRQKFDVAVASASVAQVLDNL